MFTLKTIVCLWILGLAPSATRQMPAMPQKPPTRVEMKPAAGGRLTGALASLSVALEIQAVQPNLPAGLRGTVVVTNTGAEAVEFADPQSTAQLEVQTSGGIALKTAPPAATGAAGHVHGATAAVPVRLAPKESRRIELAVTDVLAEATPSAAGHPHAAETPALPSGGSTKPVLGGAYRVRARTRIGAVQGSPSATFESGWIDVTLGSK
jgi:hypothetical protein